MGKPAAWEAFIPFFLKHRRVLEIIPHTNACQGKGGKFSSPFPPVPQDLHRGGHGKNSLGILTDRFYFSPHTLSSWDHSVATFPQLTFFGASTTDGRRFHILMAVTSRTEWIQCTGRHVLEGL